MSIVSEKQRIPYPIIGTRPKEYIPWDILEPYREQALRNHGQTLEQLAKRGGLDWTEVAAIIKGKTLYETRNLSCDEAKQFVLGRVAVLESAHGLYLDGSPVQTEKLLDTNL